LSTLVVLFIVIADSLEWVNLEEGQLTTVGAFVVAASNFGFATLMWAINRGTPNPTAP